MSLVWLLDTPARGAGAEEQTTPESSETGGASAPPLEDFDFGDEFSDLESPEAPAPQVEEEQGANATDWTSRFDLTGYVGLSAAYGFDPDAPKIGEADYHGFTRSRAELSLQLDIFLPANWKARLEGKGFYDGVYRLRGRDDYTDQVLDGYEDGYEKELELVENYVQGSVLPWLDLKLGRQIVNWGYADSFRVLDVLNPLDNREPGLVDIEDLRLPVTMSLVEAFWGDWTLSAAAIHENRLDKLPRYGNPYNPSPVPDPPRDKPKTWGFDPEYAFSAASSMHGFDLSVRYARVYENYPRAELIFEPGNPVPKAHLIYDHISVAGFGAQFTLGSWLFKTENAYRRGLSFVLSGDETTSRLDNLIGIEYYGLPRNQTVAVEFVNQHLHDWQKEYKISPGAIHRNQRDLSLRYTANFFHEKLDLTLVGLLFQLGRDGQIWRLGLEYELSDSITLNSDLAIYQGGDGPVLDTWRHNDRVAFSIQYHF